MRRRSGGAALALATVLGGCGARPEGLPPDVPIDAVRIIAPVGITRWEPSGGVVRGDRLWVVNDRDGWIAAYALPLAPGRNAPVAAHRLPVQDGPIKFEAVAPAGREGLYLLETLNRGVWRCDAPDAGCPAVARVEAGDVFAALEETLPVPVKYLTYEALAAERDHLWIGSRGYEALDGRFTPWVVVGEPGGRTSYDGPGWVVEGRSYGLSDLLRDGDGFWMTWSSEGEGDGRDDVAGLLAWAPATRDGRPGAPQLCRTLPGKAEGVARHRDALLVIFDEDLARKDPADARKFALAPDEDVVLTVPATCGEKKAKKR
ncbi:MAG: hypothetical protein H6701_14555 [Myxococcales bacterium]|nr:hypothetical protein [Myxococcales bacterium]